MKYKKKPNVIEAFCFTEDSEIISPDWFKEAVSCEKVFIDRCINDGAVHIYGCTICSKFGRIKAKIGDYIIFEPTGEITICKAKEFQKQYERV